MEPTSAPNGDQIRLGLGGGANSFLVMMLEMCRGRWGLAHSSTLDTARLSLQQDGAWAPWFLQVSLGGGIWGARPWSLCLGNLSPWPWFLSLQPSPDWKSQFLRN